ncbi:MAG: MlaD family protein [Candidatus Hydrogenedentales bacterium]|jgi:phospholipid/cholesterol/gamma-HCH transport system substrate-binding protein
MPARKHDFTVTEIKAGILVFASVCLFIVFLAVINGYRPKQDVQVFTCYFKDTLGLNRGADVRFGGLKVGRVRSIAPDQERLSYIRVEAVVPKDLLVNQDSVAYVSQTTLTAEKHLEIATGEPESARLASGAEIPVREGDLFNQAGQVAGSIKDVLDDVQALLGVKDVKAKSDEGEVTSTVATLFEGLDKAVEEGTGLVTETRDIVGSNRESIDAAIKRVQDIENSANELVSQLNELVSENRESLKASLEKVPTIVDRVADLAENLDEISAGLQATLDQSSKLGATANDALTDYRPIIEDTVVDLRQTVRHLRDFSETIAEEPQSFIRGATPRGRKAE